MISKIFFKRLRLFSLNFLTQQRLSIFDIKDPDFIDKYHKLRRFSQLKFHGNFDLINGVLSYFENFDFANEICFFEGKFILNQCCLMKFRRTRKKQLFEEFAKANNLHHEN